VARFLRSRQVQVVRSDFGRASDAELLRAGTAEAFEEVYDRHASQVLAWARARVGEHAADLTAEVFARAWLQVSVTLQQQDTGSPAVDDTYTWSVTYSQLGSTPPITAPASSTEVPPGTLPPGALPPNMRTQDTQTTPS